MTIKVTTPSDLEIEMSRILDAPRALVFAVHTRCEHVKNWWGRGNPLDCEMDFRVGGKYRFVEHAPEDGAQGFRGEFREIVPGEKIVWTFEWEGMPGHILVETITFTDQDGKTLLTSRSVFDTKEDRDGMLETGMADGAEEAYQALERYIKTLG